MTLGPDFPLSDGARKTAIVLLSLDQVMAAEVLGKLPREQVERVTLLIANAENITRDEQELALNEFKVAFQSRPLMQPVGPTTARELLERTLDRNEVEPVQERIEEQIRAGPFAFLHDRHPEDIQRLIEVEHPQTVAVITAQLPPALAAQVLAGFEAEAQADILSRLARLGPTDVEVLDEIAPLLRDRMGRIPVRSGGISRAADVLRESVHSISRSVLRSIDEDDAHLAKDLRESLFSFKDIIFLDESALRLLVQETDQLQWAVALKGSPETLRECVFASMHPSLARALKDEMDTVGPLRLSEITAVQREITEAIRNLEIEDKIELPRKPPKSRARRSVDLMKD